MTRELPVMFLSALEDVKNKAHGFEVGGNDYLTKPFEVLEVKARVRSLLKAKAYADAVREAMTRDLRIAREIQMGILPIWISRAIRRSRAIASRTASAYALALSNERTRALTSSTSKGSSDSHCPPPRSRAPCS